MKPHSQPRLRVRVSSRAESAIRSGHPWVYGDSIREVNRDGKSGELAVIYDRRDAFLALGLYDPGSPIRVRVLVAGKPTAIDNAFWKSRVETSLLARVNRVGENTDGYRLIHGESDRFPGLVVDRYASTLVLKIYSRAWLPFLPFIRDALVELIQPKVIVLRMSRNSSNPEAQEIGATDVTTPLSALGSGGFLLFGELAEHRVIFLESGLQFEAEVVHGQKTGFFLDQRENRRRVESLSAGRRVVNTFSYSGGFSVYAARGGATQVTDVDINPHALEAGGRNFARNTPLFRLGCSRTSIRADVFEWFQGGGSSEPYDLIVVDPPSMAKREAEREDAVRAYGRLAAGAICRLAGRGILVSASCSAHVSQDEFFQSVLSACAASRRKFREIERTTHPPDHPSGFAEAAYLKCIYVAFD